MSALMLVLMPEHRLICSISKNCSPDAHNNTRIRPYFFDDPRMLALHGLCNTKFKRVVMCLPGWQESKDKNACWYLICSGYQAAKE